MEVFISYSSKDVEVVRRSCAELKRNSIEYWVAFENECFGEQYATTIIKQISECKVFLIFVSSNSNLSSHVINEINSAVMRDKLILPVLLDDVKLSPPMEYYLASNHYLNYSSSEQSFGRLIDRISGLLGKKTVTASNGSSIEAISNAEFESLQKKQILEILMRFVTSGEHITADFMVFQKI